MYTAARAIDPDNLTELDQYWVGYFRADGSLSIGTAQFGQKHREPVAAFASYLGLEEGRVRVSYVRPDYPVFSLSSVGLGRTYRLMGVKSVIVNQELYMSRHFWRGMIDGDGGIYCRPPRPSEVQLNGSGEDVHRFCLFVERLIGYLPISRAHGSIFRAALSGDKAKLLLHDLYEGQYSALTYKREAALAAIARPYSARHARRMAEFGLER